MFSVFDCNKTIQTLVQKYERKKAKNQLFWFFTVSMEKIEKQKLKTVVKISDLNITWYSKVWLSIKNSI